MVSLLTTIFVMVDDWYVSKGQTLMSGKPGAKPVFSDSEMLTLMLAQDFIPYPAETQYVGLSVPIIVENFPNWSIRANTIGVPAGCVIWSSGCDVSG
jgi:hypothetical protein